MSCVTAICAHASRLLDVGFHLGKVGQHRLSTDTQCVAVAGLVHVEDRLDRGAEALNIERLIDRPLGLAQGERRHLGDLFGKRH